jgi:hypothetical protein
MRDRSVTGARLNGDGAERMQSRRSSPAPVCSATHLDRCRDDWLNSVPNIGGPCLALWTAAPPVQTSWVPVLVQRVEPSTQSIARTAPGAARCLSEAPTANSLLPSRTRLWIAATAAGVPRSSPMVFSNSACQVPPGRRALSDSGRQCDDCCSPHQLNLESHRRSRMTYRCV